MDGNRWRSAEGQRVAAEVVSHLRRGRSLDRLGLGEVAGRVDLRGFQWPAPEFVPRRAGRFSVGVAAGDLPELRGARLAGLDFSGAALPHLRFHDSTVVDCMFDGAAMGDLRAWHTTFERCDLTGADLRGSTVGSWHEGKGNTWRDCRFEKTKLQKIVAVGALFEGSVFADVNLADVVMDACSFRGVRFSGPLSEVNFYGAGTSNGPASAVLEDLDLRAAKLSGVGFIGFSLAGVRFPEDGDFAVLPGARTRLERVLERLEGDTSDEAHFLRVTIGMTVKRYQDDSDLFVNYDDLVRDCGPGCAELMRRLVG